MRVGLVRRGFSETGGAEAYLLRLAGGLAASGHEPVLVTSSEWPESAWGHGRLVRIDGSTPTAFARAFDRVKGEFDVTLSLDRTPGCDVFRAGDGVHAAWLNRRAAFSPKWKSFLRRWNPKHAALVILEREVFRQTRVIIANSQMVAKEITHYYQLPPERMKVIYNGIASSIPLIDREAARSKLGVPDGVYCVLFVGTGWERKGLAFAVKAVDSLPFESLLLVAGRGRPSQYAGRRTRFLGATRDLSALFSVADIFILPTIYDPFSNACLEAAAAGLPVLTTTANGFAEVLTPGVHGDAVEPGDIAGLGQCLTKWREATASAAACRALASEYSLKKNVSLTVEVLRQAAE